MDISRVFTRLLAVSCAAILSACAPLGPQSISQTRPLYNEAVQQTEAQQLLLNIVRQRYNDPVMFLDVTSISSGTSRTVNASLLAKIIPSGKDEFTNGLGATYGESPIIFYAPNTGEKFVRQMLTPLDLRTITLILQSGWSIERVLLVAGESLNAMRNLTSSSAAPTGKASDDKDYATLAAAMRDLQRTGDLIIGVEAGAKDAPASLTLTFSPVGKASPIYPKICQGLNVSCDGRTIFLRQGIATSSPNSDAASIATRSMYSAMFFLSQGVDVPSDDAARGAAVPNRDATPNSGIATARGNLFHVRTSATEPQQTSVKIFYRNAWFYIPDTDADSKVTFALMSMFLMLQAGDTAKITPLIALPAM